MYTRYYDSYPAVLPSKSEIKPESKEPVVFESEIKEPENLTKIASKGGLFQSVQADDIILIALIFLLFTESDDIIMLLIIGYLLLGDKLPI